ncbi:MAG: HAMP domain-containing sensor histidine kinase [Oscillospiraceae bacterium]
MRFISIKTRVTVWFTFMMVVIVTLVLTFMLVVSGSVVTNDAEGRLVSSVQENASEVDYDNGMLDMNEFNLYHHSVYTLIYDGDGGLISGAGLKPFDGDDRFENAVTRKVEIEGEKYLVYDLYVTNPDGDLWLRGMISTENSSSAIHTLVILSVIIFPVLVVIAAVGGWLIAKSAFKPVRRISDTVDKIADGSDLSARIGLKQGRDEIHRLASTFDRMFDRLETSFDSEKRFASDASHELRTPTAVILAECEYAMGNAKTVEDYRETIEVVERQANNMSALINQLLSITRMDQGTQKTAPERANLTELVEVVCGEIALTDTRGISLKTELQPSVFADIDVGMISRLVQNLVENAYKYGRDGGNVTVSLRSEGENALFSVADDGIGIAPEELPNIWRRFWQADASRGVYGGSGLGLSMVQQIAEAHGGRMSVESTPDKGSVFTLTLPIKGE